MKQEFGQCGCNDDEVKFFLKFSLLRQREMQIAIVKVYKINLACTPDVRVGMFPSPSTTSLCASNTGN